MEQPPEKPKRRPRYSGKNPRAFHERYKELAPEKYPETIQKIMASGKTPAGMHRPIMVQEILEVLRPRAGEVGVDCTLGFGGHTIELLKSIQPGGRVIALDQDPIELPKTEIRLREAGYDQSSLVVRHSNFAGLPKVLGELELSGVDFLLADLGVSSMQLNDPDRGFSYKINAPLDLRMNPQKGIPAAEFLKRTTSEKLARILQDYSDEPQAELIAVALTQNATTILTTTDLRRAIESAFRDFPRAAREREGDAPIRRTFQALRIAVNDEFGALETLLRVLPQALNPGGRAAILTFHSGEDRRVKHAFFDGLRSGLYAQISTDPVRPGPEEQRLNTRSTSAKLRWAVKAIQ